MKLKYLRLKNFGIIRAFEKHFQDGITMFSGKNGQGKSTAGPDALGLLLFDSFDGNLEDFLNWDDPSGFEVEGHFEHRGMLVETGVSYNGSTSRWLKVDGAPRATGASQVKQALAEILDPKMDLPAMIAFQKTADLIAVTPSERREHLRKMFDVNFNPEVSDLSIQIVALSSMVADLDRDLMIQKATTFTRKETPELPFSEQELLSKEKEKILVEGSIVRVQADIESVNEKVKARDDARLDADRARLSFEDVDLKLVRFNEQPPLPPVPPVPDMKQDPAYLSALAETDVSAELQMVSEAVAVLSQEDSLLIPKRLTLWDDASHQSVLSQAVIAKTKVQQAQIALDQVQAGECPTCGQAYSADLIGGTEENLELASLALVSSEALAEESRKAKEAWTESNQSNMQTRERKAEIARKKDALASEASALSAKSANAHQKLDALAESWRGKASAYESAVASRESLVEARKREGESLAHLWQDKLVARDSLKKVYDDLASKPVPSTLEFLQEREDLLKVKAGVETEIREYRDAQVLRKSVEQDNEAMAVAEKARDEKILSFTAEIQKATFELEILEETKTKFQKEFPMFIVLYLVSEIQKHANDFLQDAYGGRYKLKFIEKGNALLVTYGPKDKDVAKNSSGFESQVFSMAYKVGVARAQGLGFMVLDEPDSYADEENSEQFYRVLAETKDVLPQILTITHRRQAKNMLKLEFGADVVEFVNGEAI